MDKANKCFFIKQGLGKDLVLSDGEHNHLANVLRLKAGDEITLICGDEFNYQYRIEKITKRDTELKYISKSVNQCNPGVRLTVYLGVIKFDNLAFAVQKLNEIGVSEMVLFSSGYCQNVPVKIEKLQTTAEQSCKQCGRSIPLKVRGVLDFTKTVKEIAEKAAGGVKNTFFADEDEDTVLLSEALRELRKEVSGTLGSEEISIIIGPEGGFTETERSLLKQAARPVSLGCRIMRAETAAVVGTSVIFSALGEI